MVNYKRVVCEVAMLAVVMSSVAAAPPANCADRHFDQRQNGTENYRLNIDGVVIAVAPADSLLAAASDIDLSDLLDLDDFNEVYKPKPPSSDDKPQKPQLEPKPQEAQPQETKPDAPLKPAEAPLSDVSLNNDIKSQKKEASTRKHEKTQRLKNRLANILLPLLRRTRHH